jgi:hypothetical protein
MKRITYTDPSNYLAHLFWEFALIWDVDGICMHYTLLTEVDIVYTLEVLMSHETAWYEIVMGKSRRVAVQCLRTKHFGYIRNQWSSVDRRFDDPRPSYMYVINVFQSFSSLYRQLGIVHWLTQYKHARAFVPNFPNIARTGLVLLPNP